MNEFGPLVECGQPDPMMAGDLTRGPILRTLVLFSLPMLAANLLQTLNSTINAVWIGRLIGEAALAATANVSVILFLFYAVISGLASAACIRIGHSIGARDAASARRAYAGGIGFCVAVAAATGLAGDFASRWLLQVLATPQESFDFALTYLRIAFLTLPLGTVSMVMGMGLRAAGDARTPLYAMILTVVLDAALNPLLILGLGPLPELGIAGSAIAMAIANLLGTVFMIAIVQTRAMPLRLRGREWSRLLPDARITKYILAKGTAMGAQMFVFSTAGLVMIGLVNRQGLEAAAAYGAALQIWNYLNMPAFAAGMGVSAIAAQCIGAGDYERVGEVTRIGLVATLVMMAIVSALTVGLGRPMLALFLGSGSPSLAIGEHILAICTWSFAFGAIAVILNGTMRAYGEVVLPLIVMVLAMYPGRIGFYCLARPWLGEEAVWWAYPAGTILSVALTWLAYARGSWRPRLRSALAT